MRLGNLLSLGLACVVSTVASDSLKTQLELFDRVPGQSAPNAFRILFVGDSITRHGVADWTRRDLGWDHEAGMAASSADKDFVHLLAGRIQDTMPDRKVEIYFDSQVTTDSPSGFKAGTFAYKQARLQSLKDDFHPHLVVVQLGEHEEPSSGVSFMRESCDRLFASLKALAPDSGIISTGVWMPGDRSGGHNGYATGWGAEVEAAMQASCLKYGVPFASVRDFALDPSGRGAGTNPGVQWHPNDKGMEGYAGVLFGAFKQTQAGRLASSLALPAARAVTLDGDIGVAFRLGVERLRQPPYDSAADLRADLTQELKRLFTNYSGDKSGRYIEVATATAPPSDSPPVLEELLKTLPEPQPDGHFGVAVDWTAPLGKPDPLTAVKMPIFWGNSRLLVGLIDAYESTHETRLLKLACGIGDFYLATADRFLDPTHEPEFRSSGTYAAGYVTCYFPGIESLVRLYQVTGEEKYLKQARRMADLFPAYDHLPLDHTHGNLLTQRALLLLYEATGVRGYLEHVLQRWDEAMKGGYVWVTGGLGEHFQVAAGCDEGCALADWLRLDLELWRLTTQTKYLDAAERLLANEYGWNRFPNGGYGQLDFRGDDSGPFVLQPGHYWQEATWCCTLHGLLGLNDLKRYVAVGSPHGIFVNFPVAATAQVQAMGAAWRVATESLPVSGDIRRLRITVQGERATPAPPRVFLRRPSWSNAVDVVTETGASVPTLEKDGYIQFPVTPGAPVIAALASRPRMEDRRFGAPALDPAKISRHAKIVLTSGPELLMANADRPPVVVVAVGADGQLILPPAADGMRSMVTVASADAGETQIADAIRAGPRMKIGRWSKVSHETPAAFVFDAIAVPSESDLGRGLAATAGGSFAGDIRGLDLPAPLIAEAYERAAAQNVLAAVNPKVFFGYWSVCADGQGFGYGNTYPALDGHQMTDALLWLGQVDVVKANWNYVKQFQKPDGQLPFAIWPGKSGHDKLWFKHHVPGDPLRALSAPTYIQNADVIFRFTQDRAWLHEQLPSINLAADHLAALVTPEGAVGGAGYYVERPTRVEFDGVAQCHAVDAFRRLAGLEAADGNPAAATKYRELADRIESNFRTSFWLKEQSRFIEYINPEHGAIASHGLTDVDWSALATGVATEYQKAVLWPQLRGEKLFYYGGMPTGIATLPGNYAPWEVGDRMDLAAMGRVWYLEAWARTRMGDADGLVESIRRVCSEGRAHGYFWRERYGDQGGYGVEKYCEYPANLIRIVQRFLLGVEMGLDGTLVLKPTVPDEFWAKGFGQTLGWNGRLLHYRMKRGLVTGTYSGAGPQRLGVFLGRGGDGFQVQATVDGERIASEQSGDLVFISIPSAPVAQEHHIEIKVTATGGRPAMSTPQK
ncbi:MAG TPA: beta-L-arabinofuranosidase domain-containing protein [Lacunisphaera sp.]|nr:beta-L-arabinofuranosidase domain-containing protein [Lacunisphaera sp.]